MTAQSMNYTGRIDIELNEVSATYREENGQCVLTINWLLGHYNLNKTCQLYLSLEGDQTSESRRFDLGLLGDGQGERVLTFAQMRNPELVKLRLKVVETNLDGIPLIKAQGDKISPVNLNADNRSRSFLKMVSSPDLTVPWRVEFPNDEPTLMISEREDLYQKLRNKSQLFEPLVLADVVRQVFIWMANSELAYGDEILKEWLLFFERLLCPQGFIQKDRSNEDDYEDVMEMANVVSEEFAKKYEFNQSISSIIDAEEQSRNG